MSATPAEQAVEILKALEAVEWEGSTRWHGEDVAACPAPSCGYVQEGGKHGSHCELAAALTLARSLVSALEADGWRPIDSAPKDGTDEALVFTVAEDVRIASWRTWDDPVEDATAPHWSEYDGGHFHRMNPQPTHWMPLPPAPASPVAEEGER